MEEDVEIELLLKSNEQMLQEAAFSTNIENNLEGEGNTEEANGAQINNGKISENMVMVTKNRNIQEWVEYCGKTNVANENNNITPDVTTEVIGNEDSWSSDEVSSEESEISQNSVSGNNKTLLKVAQTDEQSSHIGDAEIRQEINYDDHVQKLIDSHLLNNMTRHFVPLYMNYSDDESISSENNYGSYDEDDYGINEIIEDDEPKFRGRVMEQIRNKVGNRSKGSESKTINELITENRIILGRENVLKVFEANLQQQFQDNEDKIQEIQRAIMSLSISDSTKIREPSFTRCFFKKFGMPYFQDNNCFTPPPNEDCKKKLEKDELSITLIPKIRYWRADHKKMLLEAIRQTLIEENCETLVKEVKKLKETLGIQSIKIDDDVLKEEILEKQCLLRHIRNKSYTELVSQEPPNREYDWMKYSVSVFNGLHSPEECKRFWHIYLKPSVNKASWEVHEDLKLLEIAEQMEYQDWDAIAKLLGTNRTAYQCLLHCQTRIHTKHDCLSGKWSKEEDKKLLDIINASRIGDFIPWTKVSSHMGNRTHSQIYNRWVNCLNPKLKKGKFTKEEDLLIVSGTEVFGASYKEMSSLLSNRTGAQIRERYERYLLPRTSKIGSWSLEEDERLLILVEKHGEQNWVAVAKNMKTRSRTQVRQRHGFIQHMMKTQPGWTIAKVKRKQSNNCSKVFEKTKRNVEKVKKEIDNIIKVFNLSKLESETFRIKKLKELRDKIMQKRFDLKCKKKVFSDNSPVNNLLLDYFKHCLPKPLFKNTKFKDNGNREAYLNEILCMAKYFGHELQLPKVEGEIMDNPRMGNFMKSFLQELIKTPIVHSVKNPVEISCSSSSLIGNGDDINYVAPESDDTILMNDWWHTPPVDVTRLNFSEFFKRTVFDYSYGMHQDIWASKLKRPSLVNFSSISEPDKIQQQPFHIPPNLLTAVGLRSILLSRPRIKRDASGKGLATTTSSVIPDNQDKTIKNDKDLEKKLLNQFQETLITLFTWPKVLSLTNISCTPVGNAKLSQLRRNKSKNTDTLPDNSNVQTKDDCKESELTPDEDLKENKIISTILEQSQDRKRKLGEHTKGIRYKRKMKIEHLMKNQISTRQVKINRVRQTRSKVKISTSNNVDPKSPQCTGQTRAPANGSLPKRKCRRKGKPNDLSVTESEIDESECSKCLKSTKITYAIPKKTRKRPSIISEVCEPLAKTVNCDTERKKTIEELPLGEAEHCLENSPKYQLSVQQCN